MMKDVDRLSRYIGILIHRYLVQINHMRANDIVLRLSTYFYDTFDSCSNPCRVTVSDTTIVTKDLPLFLRYILFIVLLLILLQS